MSDLPNAWTAPLWLLCDLITPLSCLKPITALHYLPIFLPPPPPHFCLVRTCAVFPLTIYPLGSFCMESSPGLLSLLLDVWHITSFGKTPWQSLRLGANACATITSCFQPCRSIIFAAQWCTASQLPASPVLLCHLQQRSLSAFKTFKGAKHLVNIQQLFAE